MRHSSSWYRCALLLSSFVGLSPAIAHTQSIAETRPGHRVQLIMRDSLRKEPIFPARQMVVGQFVRATADSVWLRPTGASEFSVARSIIKRASVSRGSSRLRSALTFGFSAGFGFAAAVALDQIDNDRSHRAQEIWIAGGVGLGAGTIIGAVSPYEHWRGVGR